MKPSVRISETNTFATWWCITDLPCQLEPLLVSKTNSFVIHEPRSIQMTLADPRLSQVIPEETDDPRTNPMIPDAPKSSQMIPNHFKSRQVIPQAERR